MANRYLFGGAISQTKNAIVESYGVCRWRRTQHTFLFGPCRAVERDTVETGFLQYRADQIRAW
jgi:hypothetical protein